MGLKEAMDIIANCKDKELHSSDLLRHLEQGGKIEDKLSKRMYQYSQIMSMSRKELLSCVLRSIIEQPHRYKLLKKEVDISEC